MAMNLERVDGESHIGSCHIKLERLMVGQKNNVANPPARGQMTRTVAPTGRGGVMDCILSSPANKRLVPVGIERHFHRRVCIKLESPGLGKHATQQRINSFALTA